MSQVHNVTHVPVHSLPLGAFAVAVVLQKIGAGIHEEDVPHERAGSGCGEKLRFFLTCNEDTALPGSSILGPNHRDDVDLGCPMDGSAKRHGPAVSTGRDER
jgi:hypothetical protein